jgi:hypothetical protein
MNKLTFPPGLFFFYENLKAQSLQSLLDHEGNVEEDFMMKFEISFTEFDLVKTVCLKENGQDIDLTNENRQE